MPLDGEMDESGATNDEVLAWMRGWTTLTTAKDEAVAQIRNHVKRGQSAGIDTEIAILTCKAQRKDPEVVRTKMRTRIRYGLIRRQPLDQTDLFGALDLHVTELSTQAELMFAAQEQGYRDGRNAVPIDDIVGTYPVGTEAYTDYRKGWFAGQAANAAALGENASQASAAREKPGRGRKMAAANGNGHAEGNGAEAEAPRKAKGGKRAAAAPPATRKRGGGGARKQAADQPLN